MAEQKMANDANFKTIYNKVGDLFRDIKMIDPNARNTITADNGDGLQVSVGSIYEDAGRLIPKIDNDMPLAPTEFNKSYRGLLNAKTAIDNYLTQQQQQQQQAAGRRRGTKRRGTKRRGTKRRGTKRRRSSRK
jgi:hypothetical protein